MVKTKRNPVLLIHGIWDTTIVFDEMSTYLTNLGWKVHRINLIPNNGSMKLEQLATQVANYIDTTFEREQPLDLVGFSMGGLVTRYYLQRLGGIERVQRYISISAPNNGTVTAYTSKYAGILQMRPNSQFLKNLNSDGVAILEGINFTVMWTPLDLIIIPAHSSRMSVGKEVKLPVWLHPWMLKDAKSLATVAAALSESLKSDHRQFQPTHDHQKSLHYDNRT